MEEAKKVNLVIDKENNCIDRNTPEGQFIEQLQREADSKAGTPMGQFMSQVIAFTEVGAVVDQTMDKKDAVEAMAQLRKEFTQLDAE